MTAVYFVVPAGLNDERSPSGGNRYDRELARELSDGLGWNVQVRPVAGSWPRAAPDSLRELSSILEAIPDHSVVLLDGLIACGVPDIMATHCERQRLVVLVHLPLADETGLDPQVAQPSIAPSARHWDTRLRLSRPATERPYNSPSAMACRVLACMSPCLAFIPLPSRRAAPSAVADICSAWPVPPSARDTPRS
ncbi:hypothetical protein J2X68_007616 [Streptomyces sp. 3330]|uniref:hypothetical protein n=1 Tax=Streptomyces sp. 3330 TaxID=2817755 RepID=UPI002865E727|nr:hypothetical protein [Streptomyces sp. 3330]MDR6980874.1 hypothetical protein [Streptomyces sp. 3330]